MNIILNVLSPRLLDAIGWTLIHSLWQGAIASLAFAVILFLSRRYSSRARYLSGIMTLVLVLAVSIFTFIDYYSETSSASLPGGRPGTHASISANDPGTVQAQQQGGKSNYSTAFIDKVSAFFKDYFSLHLPLIVTVWMGGVLFLILHFLGGFLYLQRLKVHQTRPLSQEWTDRLIKLQDEMGIKKSVRLLESLRVKTPVVIGHLKPVILFPAGLAMGLPVEQVEALILHELAHVARLDYLVNIFQQIIKILYFYHPAVRWISSNVSLEREHCCDDAVVSVSGNSIDYARALANIQDNRVWKLASPQIALAAVGRSFKLLNRIERVVKKSRMVSDFNGGFLSAVIMGICIFSLLTISGASKTHNGYYPTDGLPPAETMASQPNETAVDKKEAGDKSTGNFNVNVFTLEIDGEVILSGKMKEEKIPNISSWIIHTGSDQAVWSLEPDKQEKSGNSISFRDVVHLKKGVYKWYYPYPFEVAAMLAQGAGADKDIAIVLKPLSNYPGRSSDEEDIDERYKAEHKRLTEEKAQQMKETEYRAQRDEKLKEAELRIKREALRRAEEAEHRVQQDEKLKEVELKLKKEVLRLEEETKKGLLNDAQLKEAKIKLEQKAKRLAEEIEHRIQRDEKLKEAELRVKREALRRAEETEYRAQQDEKLKEVELKFKKEVLRLEEETKKGLLNDAQLKEAKIKLEHEVQRLTEEAEHRVQQEEKLKEAELKLKKEVLRLEEETKKGLLNDAQLKEAKIKLELEAKNLAKEAELRVMQDEKLQEMKIKLEMEEKRLAEEAEKKEGLDEAQLKEAQIKLEEEKKRLEKETQQEMLEEKRLEKETQMKIKQEELTLKKFIDALLLDKLIPSAKEYEIELSPKNLRINGVLQNPNVFEKYKNLYESLWKVKLINQPSIQISRHD